MGGLFLEFWGIGLAFCEKDESMFVEHLFKQWVLSWCDEVLVDGKSGHVL
jgi:hypothetical protein